MRKFGVISAILGIALLGAALVLRTVLDSGTWLWLPGALLAASGAALLMRRRNVFSPVAGEERGLARSGPETGRLVDSFEQRFAELKIRKPSAAVLGDLYSLGTQLEQGGRRIQATAVYRHLARFDNAYRDVAARLQQLMELERATQRRAADKLAASENARAELVPIEVRAASLPAGLAVSPTAKTERSVAPADGSSLGRYQLEREIGRGAMGTVYLGRDMAINRLVAIKAIPLSREFSDAELAEARARFFREAETAGRLNHPNIVTIYDVGEERGLAYIAMEYLKGRHLSDFANGATLMEPRKVMELMARTADALGFAHKQNVVHRDIKPANLMYDIASDVLKITDFGIARLTDAGSTRTGIVLGTPSFMSPEQLEGRIVTGHSDLFSLGVTLFQLLTGQLPFRADTMTGLMQQIAEAPHPPLKAIRPDLPDCVQGIIDRALAKTPESRFDSGAQMAAALDDCRARLPSGSP